MFDIVLIYTIMSDLVNFDFFIKRMQINKEKNI